MTTRSARLFWQVPLTILACIAGSLIVVWAVSQGLGLAMNISLIVVLSAVLSAAALAIELRA